MTERHLCNVYWQPHIGIWGTRSRECCQNYSEDVFYLVEGECYAVCFSFLFYVNFKMDNLKRSILKFQTSILKFHFQQKEYIEMNIKKIKVFMVKKYTGMERLF